MAGDEVVLLPEGERLVGPDHRLPRVTEHLGPRHVERGVPLDDPRRGDRHEVALDGAPRVDDLQGREGGRRRLLAAGGTEVGLGLRVLGAAELVDLEQLVQHDDAHDSGRKKVVWRLGDRSMNEVLTELLFIYGSAEVDEAEGGLAKQH